MNLQLRFGAILPVFLLLLSLSGCGSRVPQRQQYTVPPTVTAAYEETAAADITVTDESGQNVMLSDYLGQPVILKFWASWCEPCGDEMPALQRAYEVYGKDIAFLAVNLTDGTRETKASARTFIDENDLTMPILYDLDGSAARAYHVGKESVTVFIDADGFIVTQSTDFIDEETLLFGLKLL